MSVPKRIHIVGAGPRTGTTLMAEAMNACFDIDLYPSHEDRLFLTAPPDVETFLTKHPPDVLVVGPRLKVDPHLYVINMIRDPRDIVSSTHGADPDRYWTGLRYWKTLVPIIRQLEDHSQFITVRYEDFVSNPNATQERLAEEMPFLTRNARFSQYHEVARPGDLSQEALKGIRPITPESVGRWKNHLPRIAGQLELHGPITSDLIEYGYESDDSWLEELEGVEPDLRESHWPEYFTKEELKKRQKGKYKEVLKGVMRRMGLQPTRIKPWIPFKSYLLR